MSLYSVVKLFRNDSTPWGFRLQGGKDFGTPLVIQKVNYGSLAEKAGLQVGDAIIKINNIDVSNMKHKDAQDVIVHAGNSFETTIQRGGVVSTTWKPSVTPVGQVPSPGGVYKHAPTLVTKTSLEKIAPPSLKIGSYNANPRPFISNTHDGIKLVNKQTNSPINIYSDQSIAETLSAQAEVLAGGVLGVNFKKNEKNYTPTNSEVLKMVQEADQEPKSPDQDVSSDNTSYFAKHSHAVGGRATSPAPVTPYAQQMGFPAASAASPVPSNIPTCGECSKIISGVFVRIKERNLHVECFKCATCGTSLKNVGYYSINNKLYCDVHAKMIAKQNPHAGHDEPLPPVPRTPVKSISAAINSHNFKQAPSAPKINAPKSPIYQAPKSPAYQAPKSPVYQAPRPAPVEKQIPISLPPTYTPAPSLTGPKPFGNRPSGRPGSTGGSLSQTTTAPRRGRGVLNPESFGPGARTPLCGQCFQQIRGPFITALGKIWCPDHFICVRPQCRRPLQDIGFVEEDSGLYCEYCFEQYLAPNCSKCSTKIKGDCLNAIGKHFHPQCFTCAFCGKLFGNNPFFLEEGLPYCENDWNDLFTTKCFACGFPIEAGDHWVEALNNNYHSLCFNCSVPSCKKNLEGQSFFAKAGRPFCKAHAR